MGKANDVEAEPGQREVGDLDQISIRELASHQDITAHANALPRDNRFDGMQFFAKFQADGN